MATTDPRHPSDPWRRRTDEVLADLRLLGDDLAPHRHLVLHRSVDPRLVPPDAPLPARSVDARGADAVELVLDDPTAALVVSTFTSRPRPGDLEPRWAELRARGRLVATLTGLGLSGRYCGLVRSDGAPHSLGGVVERVVATDLEVVLDDATSGRIDRTTVGALLHHDGRTSRHGTVLDALRALPRLPVEVRSTTLDAVELRRLLAEADRLVPPRLSVRGR